MNTLVTSVKLSNLRELATYLKLADDLASAAIAAEQAVAKAIPYRAAVEKAKSKKRAAEIALSAGRELASLEAKIAEIDGKFRLAEVQRNSYDRYLRNPHLMTFKTFQSEDDKLEFLSKKVAWHTNEAASFKKELDPLMSKKARVQLDIPSEVEDYRELGALFHGSRIALEEEQSKANRPLSVESETVERKTLLEEKVRVVHEKLPADLLSLPSNVMRDVSSVYLDAQGQIHTPKSITVCPVSHPIEGLTGAEVAGIIRREIQYRGRQYGEALYDEEGQLHTRLECDGFLFDVISDEGQIDPIVTARDGFDDGEILRIIPRSHLNVSLHSIGLWEKSPTSPLLQAKQIEAIKNLPNDLRSWVILGPWGTSKTAFVSVWLKDEITFRQAINPDSEPCVWRIKANEWLAQNLDWTTRDFDDHEAQPPDLSVSAIESACAESGSRPILWVEEFDKFSPSPQRRNLMDSLVDAIYELDGMIIVTTNFKRDDLKKYVGGATYRRITGENDADGRFAVWSFHPEDMKKKSR